MATLVTVIAGLIFYILAIVNTENQDLSRTSTQQAALRVSQMDVIQMIENDFKNIGSNYDPDSSYFNHPDDAIVGFDTLANPATFTFRGQTEPLTPPVDITYSWETITTSTIHLLRDSVYVAVHPIRLTRTVDGSLAGQSSGIITRFQIGLLNSDGTDAVVPGDTRQVSISLSMASRLGASSHTGETHYRSVIRPAAMARFDYEDYIFL